MTKPHQQPVSDQLTSARLTAPFTVVLIALLAGLANSETLSALAAGARRPAQAHAARTLNITDNAHLHYLKAPGSALLEEGSATGGLPGTVKLKLYISATVTGSFTIYAHDGSITGHGSGTLHGTGVYASFGGTMTVTQGTGHYTHAHGHGGFYGTINRHTYALTVQTTGTLVY